MFHQSTEDILSFFQVDFSISNSSSGISSSISENYENAVQLCEVFTFLHSVNLNMLKAYDK